MMVKNAENTDRSFARIEAVLMQSAETSPDGCVKLAEVQSALGKMEDDDLRDRIVRALRTTQNFLPLAEEGRFQLRSRFFAGGEFLITPNAYEIEQGILIPGHRFSPFMTDAVFPSDVELTETESGRAVSKRQFTARASELMHAHLLLGAEELLDFFIAEDAANATAEGQRDPMLKLTVFDLKDWYEKTEFAEGDALRVKVADFASGKFTFQLDDGCARTLARRTAYCERFEKVLLETLERHSEYLTIVEQLQYAFARGGKALLEAPAASLDEIVHGSEKIEIALDGEASTLVPHVHDETDDCDCDECSGGDLPPEGVGISMGETGSLGKMLQSLQQVVTATELESFMLDQCYRQEYDFDSFCQRAFGEGELPFADEGQKAVFFNVLEERWEDLCENYSRDVDGNKAELRADILELTTARRELFKALKDSEVAPEKLPEAEVHNLAEASGHLEQILALLNRTEAELTAEEAGPMAEAVDQALDLGTGAIEAIRAAVGLESEA